MNIAVIEDEKLTSDDLVDILLELEPYANVVAVLRSVAEAVAYFEKSPQLDLIFSDIQLGDGLSFEIFKKVEVVTPVIFCTAYDEYTLTAFKANGIAYVLKPFTKNSIQSAIEKFKMLQRALSPTLVPYNDILKALSERSVSKASSILVHYKEKIIPVRLEDIALFYIRHEVTHLLTFDKATYIESKTLDELERFFQSEQAVPGKSSRCRRCF
jgi:two-component system response regulator LytT